MKFKIFGHYQLIEAIFVLQNTESELTFIISW